MARDQMPAMNEVVSLSGVFGWLVGVGLGVGINLLFVVMGLAGV